MRKDDLVATLDEHLNANSSSLSTNPSFSGYYNRVRSPIKKEPESLIPSSVTRSVKRVARRVSKFPSSDVE